MVSISPVSVLVFEGNSGTATVTLTVGLSQSWGSTVTVGYGTANGSASAGQDYTAASGTVIFTAGQTSQDITVTVLGDAAVEFDETFTVTLSAPSGATVGTATSTVTVINDDAPLPVVSISPASVSVTEGNSGSKAVTFTVGLSQAAGSTVTVGYVTANGSATAGQDYTAASGTVIFTAGQTSQQVSVTVAGDTVIEADETLTVTLSAPSGATLGTAVSTVTITNDELPTVSISPVNVSVAEGNSGSKTVTFAVSLSQAAGSTVTVGYTTANGSATAGQDYTAASGTVTFAAGQTSQQVTVTVLGDAAAEADETFTVALSAPSGVSLAAARTSTVTITNDDASAPVVSVNPVSVSVAEGNSGSKAVTFTVVLSQAAVGTVTVRFATANGSATAGQDYTAASGMVTFAAGQTSRQVTVTVAGDTATEADETFTLALSAPSGATVGMATSTVTITNDDGPVVSISPVSVSVAEGNSGSKTVTFTVGLSRASGSAVTVRYGTANGTATAGQDYTAASGTVTFAAGQTSQQVTVAVAGDAVTEANETFTVTLSAPSGATLGVAKTSTVTITNDDISVPVVTISPVSTAVAEGNSGSKTVTFTVGLSQAAGSAVTVRYGTANGTATAGQDYTAASGTVTFAAGQTSQQVTVAVAGDAVTEANETFTVTLSAPSGATLGVAKTSTVTITNDDLPAVSISPVSTAVSEGNSGSKTVTFTVALTQVSKTPVTVSYNTADGSARSGQDYTAASGTLTFTAGQTSKQVSVTILGDRTVEANETLTLNLSAPTGVVLGTGKVATITITNDDSAPAAARAMDVLILRTKTAA